MLVVLFITHQNTNSITYIGDPIFSLPQRRNISPLIQSPFITVLSDDDDDGDGILSISDEISSFGFQSDDDDDVKRHQKINNAIMTI